MRVSGLATGMDTDNMVKEMMKPYQLKVDNYKKDSTIYEYRQQLYRDVLKDSQDFYNKYFDPLSKDSLLSSKKWGSVTFTSSNSNAVIANGSAGAVADNYSVNVEQIAKKASQSISSEDFKKSDNISITFGNKTVTVDRKLQKYNADGTPMAGEFYVRSDEEMIKELNNQLSKNGIEVTARNSSFAQGVVFESKNTGESQKFSVTAKVEDGTMIIDNREAKGENAIVKINNGRDPEYVYKGEKNITIIDNIEFTFLEKTEASNPVKLTGTVDVENAKENIVNFINDYNKLVENINTKLYEKRDKKYMPLTEDEKKAMSEEERKLWDAKVKTGLLRNDGNLRTVVDGMKAVMSSFMPQLEKIGISPVKDYTSKNGMLVIDEAKLTAALENNAEDVKNIFTKQETVEGKGDGGIISRLKKHLYDNTVTVTSSLMQKVGMENSSTATTNEYTKMLDKRKRTLEDMQKDLLTRENNYYLKFSRLEAAMSKINSQQSYLTQQFGG